VLYDPKRLILITGPRLLENETVCRGKAAQLALR